MIFTDTVLNLFEYIIHIDKHLNEIIQQYDILAYLVVGLIIFSETGFVIMPFLPGDSLLFILGNLGAQGNINISIMWMVIAGSAILGDSTNYFIGKALGPKIFHKEDVKFLNKEYLDKTHRFYRKHGRKTILFARFFPIIRTFAPFVAGIGTMPYLEFICYSATGSILWASAFLTLGFLFGNIPSVQDKLILIIIVLIFMALIPIIFNYLRNRLIQKSKNNI